jgi:hypothetical protein
MRKPVLVTLLAAAACVGVGVAAAATPVRLQVVLQSAQVGKGYKGAEIRDGSTLRQPTLNLCGTAGYPSEKLREARLQVEYRKGGSPFVVDNEVVTYRAGGAAEAVREARQHVLNCRIRAAHFTVLKDPKLLPGYLAVGEVDTGVIRGRQVVLVTCGVYQRLGNVLSAVYTSGPPGPAQATLCLHAAEQAAQNLTAWYLGGPPA